MIDENNIRQIVEKIVTSLENGEGLQASNAIEAGTNNSLKLVQKVAIGADHGGFTKKEILREFLTKLGYEVIDCGTHSTDSVDYPDFAVKVANAVSSEACQRGIMLDGAGIGSSMAINKIRGCRAALCYNDKTILNSRVHNNANVLTLGAPYHEETEIKQLVKLWLETDFEGGRHQKRVAKIDALDGTKPCSCS